MIALTTVLERNPIKDAVPADHREMLNYWRDVGGLNPVSGRVNMLRSNSKLALDTGSDIAVYGLSLNPADTHGEINTCLWSTKGCRRACILHAAYQRADNVVNSRKSLTDFLYNDPRPFISHLMWEIEALIEKHEQVAIRLNVASDIRWEYVAPVLFDTYGDTVLFYDYTKAPFGQRGMRDDYTLVFSVSERPNSLEMARRYIEAGHSATIVLPVQYIGHDKMDDLPDWLADHDAHDVRTLDKGRLGALRAKVSAKSDESGFVRTIDDARQIVSN